MPGPKTPPSPLKLWRYVDGEPDPVTTDYITGLSTRLHKLVTDFSKGEVREVEWHATPAHDDLVLSVHVTYERTPNGLASSRRVIRRWYREDGTVGAQKLTTKYYDGLHQMREARRRRDNVVDQLLIDVLGMLVYTETYAEPDPIAAAEAIGIPFVAARESMLDSYRQTGDQTIVANIGVAVDAWLDNDLAPLGSPGVTIRQAMQAALTPI